ncbi:MAG: protein arginine kinase [Clostridia bacterium]|nr:protein arginine kinase [Clostridia bacterium]
MAQKWYQTAGPEGDVVISTRVRLARNLPDMPFPASMTPAAKAQLIEKVRGALADTPWKFQYLDMASMPETAALSLAERHLISPEFACREEGSGLLLSEDESVSIMLCEEDHVRLQVLCAGMQLEQAYQTAAKIDAILDAHLHFAYDERLGYLTQCPSNLGTGMRASLMLHLPMLEKRGSVANLSGTVSKLGMTVRGLYGESSRAFGAMYQLSNQITLGISEQAALANLKGVAEQILREVRAARQAVKEDVAFEDTVWRAYGLLKTARLLTTQECLELLSTLRIGVAVGLVQDITMDALCSLQNRIGAGTLSLESGKALSAAERDTARAACVRQALQ